MRTNSDSFTEEIKTNRINVRNRDLMVLSCLFVGITTQFSAGGAISVEGGSHVTLNNSAAYDIGKPNTGGFMYANASTVKMCHNSATSVFVTGQGSLVMAKTGYLFIVDNVISNTEGLDNPISIALFKSSEIKRLNLTNGKFSQAVFQTSLVYKAEEFFVANNTAKRCLFDFTMMILHEFHALKGCIIILDKKHKFEALFRRIIDIGSYVVSDVFINALAPSSLGDTAYFRFVNCYIGDEDESNVNLSYAETIPYFFDDINPSVFRTPTLAPTAHIAEKNLYLILGLTFGAAALIVIIWIVITKKAIGWRANSQKFKNTLLLENELEQDYG